MNWDFLAGELFGAFIVWVIMNRRYIKGKEAKPMGPQAQTGSKRTAD